MNSIITRERIRLLHACLDAELSVLEREPDYIHVTCLAPPIRQTVDGREYACIECSAVEHSKKYIHRSENAFPWGENRLYELSGYRGESILACGDDITIRFDTPPPVDAGGIYVLNNVKPVDILYAQKKILTSIGDGGIRLFDCSAQGERHAASHNTVHNDLNADQNIALGRCLASDCHLVLGPPGTGKTHLIAALCSELVRRGKTVLVTSWMNVAVDNALEKLVMRDDVDGALVCRAASGEYKTSYRLRPYASFSRGVLINKRVVGATLASLQRISEMGLRFDYVIIDEAGSSSVSQTLLAYMALKEGGHIALIGDHMQLPPIVRYEVIATLKDQGTYGAADIAFLKKSLFEHLIAATGQYTMLRQQYRMHQGLASLVSDLSYGKYGGLTTSDKTAKTLRKTYPYRYGNRAQDRGRKKVPEGLLSLIADQGEPVVWVSTSGNCQPEWRMASAVNKYEIYYIKRIIDELYHCKNRREALPVVGIITPYRGQAAELKKTYRGSDTRVHTIHSVQGKEMDVVIISMVDDTPTREIFKERNLFNVALSRARHKLIILCNENFITTSTPSFYTAIHDYCERRGSAYAISSKAQPVHTTAGKKLEKLSRLESRPTACVEYILKLSNRWASKDIRRHAIDTYFRLVDSSRHQATLEEVDYVTRYYADSSHLERYAPRISAVALSAPKNAVGKILISRYTNPHLVQIISRACGTAAHRGHAVQGEDE